MKPIVNNILLIGLLVSFAGITGCGIYLVTVSVETPEVSHAESKVEVSANDHGVNIKISTAIPGLIVFVFGALGLLLLVIRVPVKQICGYERPPKLPKDSSGLASPYMQVSKPILNDKVEHIPILIWWLIRRKDIAMRVKREAISA